MSASWWPLLFREDAGTRSENIVALRAALDEAGGHYTPINAWENLFFYEVDRTSAQVICSFAGLDGASEELPICPL